MGNNRGRNLLLKAGLVANPEALKKIPAFVDAVNAASFTRLPHEFRLFQSAVRHHRAKFLPEPYAISVSDTKHIYGSHAFATFQCNTSIAIETLGTVLAEKITAAGATIVGEGFLKTKNNGITGGFIIAESHVITDFIPLKNGTFAVLMDAYTCGDKLNPSAIINDVYEELKKHIPLVPVEKIDFKRGIFTANPNAANYPDETHCFVPGIAHCENSQLTFYKEAERPRKIRENCEVLGRHVVGELYNASPVITNNGELLLRAMLEAFEAEDIDRLKFWHVINFTPQGVSVVVMGPGIHATTHPWPELWKSPIDIFVTNESGIDPVAWMHRYAAIVQAQKYKVYEFDRGVHVNGTLKPVLQEYVPVADNQKDLEPRQLSCRRK